MAMFVHLALESAANQIRRSGITKVRRPTGTLPGGVFAVPVTRNFFLSHQWLRELKRRNAGPIAAVYFRIPDYQEVCVGHYHQKHQLMTAAKAVAEFMQAESREGWEVIILRRIAAAEIHRIRHVRQIFGWRYFPGSNGKKPFCVCSYCTKGEYKSASLRRRLGRNETQARADSF